MLLTLLNPEILYYRNFLLCFFYLILIINLFKVILSFLCFILFGNFVLKFWLNFSLMPKDFHVCFINFTTPKHLILHTILWFMVYVFFHYLVFFLILLRIFELSQCSIKRMYEICFRFCWEIVDFVWFLERFIF